MDSNLWAAARLSSGSRGRYQPPSFPSRSGTKWDGCFEAEMLMGFEEMDMDDDIREEHRCPFCSDYYDIVGLCCHIDDEHPVEAKNGVCPVCAATVGADMVAHITLQHGNIFKMHHRKRKSRRAGSHTTTLSLLRRELRDGNLQSMFGSSSAPFSLSNTAPDPLLSSFILPMREDYESASHSVSESTLAKKSTSDGVSEREVEKPPLSIKDQEEKAKRSEFVQGLLLSMMFEDDDIL